MFQDQVDSKENSLKELLVLCIMGGREFSQIIWLLVKSSSSTEESKKAQTVLWGRKCKQMPRLGPLSSTL
jgi:hypothetical protein